MVDLTAVIARRESVLEQIVAQARSDSRVSALLLVGSLATGTNDAYSDIDLVVLAEHRSVDALLANRLAFPAQFGDVLLQLDSSWNVWSEAAQVLTLLDGDLPLWVDIDIWPPVTGIPRDARVLAGRAPQPVDATCSEFTRAFKEAHGAGQVAADNLPGVLDVAGVAWRLKAIARGYGGPLSEVEEVLDGPWVSELERAREPLRRFAEHVVDITGVEG